MARTKFSQAPRVLYPFRYETREPQNKFVSPTATRRFDDIQEKKILVQERGLQYTRTDVRQISQGITQTVARHGWQEFCKHPSNISEPLVQEFCANFEGERPDRVIVRGMRVPLGPSVIRGVYALPEVKDNFRLILTRSIEEPFQQQINQRLRVPNVQSKEQYRLHVSELNIEARFWLKFVRSRILPSLWDEFITLEHATLVYCIIEGLAVDVGQIIFDELCVCAEFTEGRMWWPALVTELCLKARVPYEPSELRVAEENPLEPPIEMLTGVEAQREEMQTIDGLGRRNEELEEARSVKRPRIEAEEPSGSQPHMNATLEDKVLILETKMELLQAQNSILNDRIGQLEAEVRSLQKRTGNK